MHATSKSNVNNDRVQKEKKKWDNIKNRVGADRVILQ